MFRIELLKPNNTSVFLNISLDSVCTIELLSTLFNNTSDLLGSYSYPFDVTMDRHNLNQLKNAHLVSSSQSLLLYDAWLWINGYRWQKVRAQFNLALAKIQGTLLVNNGIVANQLKNGSTNVLGVATDNSSRSFNTLADYKAFLKATAEAAPGVYPMVFFPVCNETFLPVVPVASYPLYPLVTFPQDVYMNSWDAVGGQFVTDVANPFSHLETPAFYLVYVLRRIITFLGYTPVGNWLNDPDAMRIVIYSAIGVNSGELDILDMPYYLPAMTLSDFLKAIRNEFSLIIAFNEADKTCLVDSMSLVLNNPAYVDLRPYQVKLITTYVPDSTGYTITRSVDENDALNKDLQGNDILPAPVVVGDGTSGISLTTGFPAMLAATNPNYGNDVNGNPVLVNWRTPHVKQNFFTSNKYPALDAVDFSKRNAFQLRLLYYHGMQKDQQGNYYPYASSDNLDQNGQPLTKFSLTGNANSITKVAIVDYYNFLLSSKKMEVSYVLPVDVFTSLQQNHRIIFRDRNNAPVSCLLSQITADVTRYEKVLAKLIMYSRPMETNLSGIDITQNAPVVVDNGLVYAKLVLANLNPGVNGAAGQGTYSGDMADVTVQFFADAAGTVPKVVNSLQVVYQTTKNAVPDTQSNTFNTAELCTGSTFTLISQTFTDYTETQPDQNGLQGISLSYTQSFVLILNGLYSILS